MTATPMSNTLRAALERMREFTPYVAVAVRADFGAALRDVARAALQGDADAPPSTDENAKCACGHWRYGDGPNSGHLPSDGLCTVSLGDEWCPCMGFRRRQLTNGGTE